MAIATSIIVSIAVSVVLSVGMRLISSLLSQNSNQQQYGGALPKVSDPGTQLTLREAAAPQKIVYGTRRVAGTVVFMHTTQNNYLLHLVVAWAGHEIDSYGPLYFGDEEIPLSGGIAQGKFYGKVGCDDHLGAPGQAAFANLIHHAPEYWSWNHRGQGIACSYITVHWDRTLFGSFDHSKIWRVINGKKVYDPREEDVVFSHNPALIVADWMASDKFGRGIPFDEILPDELEAAADGCDEVVTLEDGSTEARYACNAVLTSDTPFVDNINKLLSSMRGEVYQLGGEWAIQAAIWEPPTLVFNEGDFREPFTVTNGIGREGFNAAKGKFANPAKNYQQDDFPAIIVPPYEIEDGGDGNGLGRVFSDLQLDCTTSVAMAQRLARVDLRAHRQPIAFTAKLKLKGLKAATGKNVAFDIALLGWSEKAFKVKRMRYVPGFGVDGQPGIIGVDLDLVETGSFIFDRAASDEQLTDPIPNTNLPDPSNILPPSNLRETEALYATRDGGGVKAKVTVSFDPSPDAFVQDGGYHIVEYKLSAHTAWTKLPRIEDGATSVEILDVDPGFYDYRAWAFWASGARSAMAPTIVGQHIAGLSAPPQAPQNLTLVPNGNFAVLRWDFPADLDVQIGGTIVFKHAAQSSGASWANGVTISRPLNAAMSVVQLPLVAGTYMAKFVDAAGTWSEDFASFATGQDGALEFQGLVGGSLVEDPAFAGVKTDCAVLAGVLKLGGAGTFSAIPLVSAVPSIFYYGGVQASGSYAWAEPMDLGSKTRSRVTIGKTTLVENVFDLLSQRTGDVSTWPQFGGGVAGLEADAITYVRTTDDDPNGLSPSWSEWARIDCGEFNCRGFEFRTDLVANDPSFDINVSALSATAEEIA